MVKIDRLKIPSEFYFLLITIGIIIFIFRDTFFHNLIPFQSNLLVTFFSPWNTMRFPGWGGGIPNKPMGMDNLNLFFPYKKLSIDLLKSFIMPLWNPYNFTGNVLLADFQSAVFYPFNLLYMIFPLVDAWSTMVVIQPLLAGFFTYLYLKSINLNKAGAFFGALTFALSGEMIVWMGDHLVVSHTILWLPLILYSLERYFSISKKRFYFLAILALTSSFFAGFFQTFTYVLVVVISYILVRFRKQKIQLIKALSIIILSLGIGAVQLLPSLEAFLYSGRKDIDVGYLYDIFRLPIGHLFSFLSPDYRGNPGAYNFFGAGYHESVLYIGIIPLIFAVLSLKLFKKNWTVKFFGITTLITLLIGIKNPLTDWLYVLRLPVFSTFLPSRIFFVTSFALSVLAGVGLDNWQAKKDNGKILKILIFFGLCMLLFGGYLELVKAHYINQNLLINQFVFGLNNLSISQISVSVKNLIPGLVVIVLSFLLFITSPLILKKYLTAAIFLLLIIPQIYFANKYLSFSYKQFIYPPHPVFEFLKNHAGLNRFWTYGDGYINANFATYYGIYSSDGTDALFPSRLGEVFYATEKSGKLISQIPRIDVRIAPAAEGGKMTDNPERLRLLSLLGVRYVTDYAPHDDIKDAEKKFFPELFHPVYQKDRWTVYELVTALPRAFLTNNFSVELDPQKILDKIYTSPISSPNVVLETAPELPVATTALSDHQAAEIISYTPNKILIKVNADKNTILFLSDSYYPGWTASVDNKPTKIKRANYAFRAVEIPKGAQTVEFTYEPASFRWGMALSLLSILIVFIISLI